MRLTICLNLMVGLLLSNLSMLTAQNHFTCDGSRYISEVFPVVDSTQGVWYGNNTTYSGNSKDLYMDIYEPSGDTASMRPAVVLAFGGSFIVGERSDLDLLCRFYASRGYVAVTIDYRLYDGNLFPLPNATTMTDVVIKAVGDMKAAVRHLRQDAATTNTYRIDPNYIFVGGVSAGALTANHVAYLDSMDNVASGELTAIQANGGWEGNSSNTAGVYSSSVQGVLNFSGALRDADYINNGEAPLFSTHDDNDGVVPYGGGNATIGGFPIIYIEGSQLMHQKADSMQVGVPNSLITIPNSSGHVSFFTNNAAQWADSVRSTSSQFLHDELLCPIIVSITQPEALQQVAARFFPNPAINDLVLAFDEIPGSYTVRLIDAVGRMVYEQTNVQQQRLVVPRGNWQAGLYQVQVQFEDGRYQPVQRGVMFQ